MESLLATPLLKSNPTAEKRDAKKGVYTAQRILAVVLRTTGKKKGGEGQKSWRRKQQEMGQTKQLISGKHRDFRKCCALRLNTVSRNPTS